MLTTRNTAADKKHKKVYVILFVVYLILLFYFLFFSEDFGRTGRTQEYHYNLVLFREIRRFTEYMDILGFEAFFLNVIGNVVAFIPFGFLMPFLSKVWKNLLLILIYSFLLSLFIEVMQLLFHMGCFDVDDLFLNTLGGVLGYIIYRIMNIFFAKRTKRKG